MKTKKTLIAIILMLCLCACASCAWALQGSDPPEEAAGLDIYYPGMSRADARKLGAAANGENQMTARVSWGGTPWKASMTFKDDKLTVLFLTTKITDNNIVFGALQAMDERLYVPLHIDRSTKGKHSRAQMFELKAKGKSEDELNGVMTNALSEYAGQEDGSMTAIFCPQDMRSRMAELVKAGKDEDEQIMLDLFGDTVVYTINMKKSDDTIHVVAATLTDLGMFAGK